MRERLLSHSETYKIIDYNYLSMMDGGGTVCQNCGAFITNMVTVECSNGKQYIIGTDCAKTLSSIGERDLKDANTSIGKLKKFYKKLADLVKYGYEVRVVEDKDRYTLNTYHTTDFMGREFPRPFMKFEGASIPKDKAHMPLITPYLTQA